jgi:hypothetical protein
MSNGPKRPDVRDKLISLGLELLDIEPRLRRVKGYRYLPMLRQAIQAELGIKQLAMTG